jgi:hypothetical protein
VIRTRPRELRLRRRQFRRHHARQWTVVHPTLSKPLHESPRPANEAAGHRRFPVLLHPSRLLSPGRLPRPLRLPRRCGESQLATPGLRRQSPLGVGIATKVRTRRSPSMRATMIRTSRLRFLTRMRSRHTSVSRALRMLCPRSPQLQRLLPLLPFPPHHLRGQAHLPSRASLPRRPGNRWICPEWLHLLHHHPRRHLNMTTTTTPTTIPRLRRLPQRYRRTQCHHPLHIRGSRRKCLLKRHHTARHRGLRLPLRPPAGRQHGSQSTSSALESAADLWMLRAHRWNPDSLLMTST